MKIGKILRTLNPNFLPLQTPNDPSIFLFQLLFLYRTFQLSDVLSKKLKNSVK